MRMFSSLKVFMFVGIAFMFVGSTVHAQQLHVYTAGGKTEYDIGDPVVVIFEVDPVQVVNLQVTWQGMNIIGIAGATPPYRNGGLYPTNSETGALEISGIITASGAFALISAFWDRGAGKDSFSAEAYLSTSATSIVFSKYKETFKHPDVHEFFPDVLNAFKDPGKAELVNPAFIRHFADDPKFIRNLYKETDDSILVLLLLDDQFGELFRDDLFHALVRSPTQIDELIRLIRTLKPRPRKDCPVLPSVPTTLSIVSGYGQEGSPGTRLANPFVVEVRDQYNGVLSGASVTFRVTKGGGTLSPTTARTDNVGRAATILTLGSSAGAHWVEASAAGITQSQTFTATAKEAIPPPDPPPTLWIVSGNSQEGKPGAPLANPFVVEVRQDGKVLSGVSVTFRVTTEGGGTLSPTTARTDNVGRAATILTLGSSAGAHWVEASAAGITQSQTFTATAKEAIPPPDPSKATTLLIVSGNGQEGKPGARLANPFVVEVRDQDGGAFSGVSVTFRVTKGGGTLSPTTACTRIPDLVSCRQTYLTAWLAVGVRIGWRQALLVLHNPKPLRRRRLLLQLCLKHLRRRGC